MLPEDCLSTILSFTSPEDAFRSSLVSATFRSAIDSDTVWERFLPPDYPEIVLSSVTPLKFSSKKELFQCLCDPVLIDGGNKVSFVVFAESFICFAVKYVVFLLKGNKNPVSPFVPFH